MCVANSARSQLAEGLAKNIFPKFEIMSAGSNPGRVNPFAVSAMKEINLNLDGHYSKSVDELPKEFINNINYVITLCAEEVCPMIIAPKAKRIHWPLPDPATKEPVSDEDALRRFQVARNAIAKKLLDFKAELEK